MATLTWSFTNDYEGWTFDDVSASVTRNPCPACFASRSYVSGAIRTRLFLDDLSVVTAAGLYTSPYLGGNSSPGDTVKIDHSATSDPHPTNLLGTVYYTDGTTEDDQRNINASAGTLTLTLGQSKVIEKITVRLARSTGVGGAGNDSTADITEVRYTADGGGGGGDPTSFTGAGVRPLELDLSLGTGNKIWATVWDSGLVQLREYSSALALQNTFTLATGTVIPDINGRSTYLTPYAPPFFDTASLDNIIYIFGRWYDGTQRHLEKSTNGGSSFSDIGDSATWGDGWIGGFLADDTNTLYAFVNGENRALYQSTNGGTTWTQLSALPFDVDPGGVSKHPDGRILIINRSTGAQMAAYALPPDYTSWIDATGSPAFPQSGGGSNAVAWIT